MPDAPAGPGYELICPYWVDIDAYSYRDQVMFACGAEFAIVLDHVRSSAGPLRRVIHRENESRVRMMCGRFGRRCTVTPTGPVEDPPGLWSYLNIAPR
jgi:hypothetical protein